MTAWRKNTLGDGDEYGPLLERTVWLSKNLFESMCRNGLRGNIPELKGNLRTAKITADLRESLGADGKFDVDAKTFTSRKPFQLLHHLNPTGSIKLAGQDQRFSTRVVDGGLIPGHTHVLLASAVGYDLYIPYVSVTKVHELVVFLGVKQINLEPLIARHGWCTLMSATPDNIDLAEFMNALVITKFLEEVIVPEIGRVKFNGGKAAP